jgi:hypothetical protein
MTASRRTGPLQLIEVVLDRGPDLAAHGVATLEV